MEEILEIESFLVDYPFSVKNYDSLALLFSLLITNEYHFIIHREYMHGVSIQSINFNLYEYKKRSEKVNPYFSFILFNCK